MSPSLRRLRYFLVVSRSLHVGRAAEELGIAQPALSQQIKALEQELGVRLFHRRKRGIDLTAAGEAYRDEVERLLAQHEQAADVARRTARGEMGSIAMGYVGSAMFEPEFPELLRNLHEHWPQLRLNLREARIEDQLRELDEGSLDLAVLRAPATLSDARHRRLRGSQRPLMAALPEGHRLLARRKIRIAELADEPMISFTDPADVAIMRVASDLAAKAGVTLSVRWRVSEAASVLGLVAAGMGYGIVPAAVARFNLPGVAFRDIADAGAVAELWYVWRHDRETPALRRVLSQIRQGSRHAD